MSPKDRDQEQRTDTLTKLSRPGRRAFLKYTGASISAIPMMGAATAAPPDDDVDVANGPFKKTYEAKPVTTTTFCGGDGGDTGPRTREGSAEEIPRNQPAGGSNAPGGGPNPSQRAVRGNAIEVAQDYDGLGAIDARGVVPSDAQLGTGPSHHVEAINSRWAIIDKESGEQTCEITLDEWFTNVSPFISNDNPGEGFFVDYIIFDSQVQYDRQYDRFLLACVDFNLNTGEGAMLLSVSDDSDPNGTWYNYRIPPIPQQRGKTGLVDYPQLGHDDDAVYLTENFFPGPFTQATMALLDQQDLTGGGTATAYHFTDLRNPDGSLAFTLQPATQPNLSGEYDDTFHLLNSRFFQGETLTLWDVEYNSASEASPTIANSALGVQPYHNPPNAKQPDTEEKIDMGDTRLMNTSYDVATGHLWTAHTINGGKARWYEVDPDTDSVVQSGNFKRAGYPTFFPTIAAQGGNATFVYNTASPRKGRNPGYASIEAAGRTADFQQGLMEDYEVVREGVDDYDYVNPGEDDNGPQTMRWGDYNGVSIDPDGEGIWIVSQYASTPDAVEGAPETIRDDYYTTRIAEVVFED
jgi:hypothetical protein